MKLVTKTIHNPDWDGFFSTYRWADYLMLHDQLKVDRSISFHNNHTVMYLIEILADEHLDYLTRKWEELVEFEKLAQLGMTVTSRVEDAFNKK
jgi:anaerobic ribonucleoside-triphosphate reductase